MKRKKFWKHYTIFVSISIVIILSISTILWIFLSSYEEGRPDYIAQNVVSWYERKNVNYISKYVSYDSKLIKYKLNNDSEENNFTYSKKTGKYTSSKPVYDIKLNDEIVGVLYLKKSKIKGLFNTARWNIDNIDMLFEKKDIFVVVPSNVNVYLDDKILTAENVIDSNYYRDYFKDLTDYVNSEYMYKINDFVEGMNLKVSDGKLAFNNDIYYYKYDNNDDLLNENIDILKDLCIKYTRYVVGEGSFYDVVSLIMPNTYTYTFLKGISRTNKWSWDHSQTVFSDIYFENMEVINDNVFKVNAIFTYSYYVENELKNYDANLTIVMVKNNNKWLVGSLNTY